MSQFRIALRMFAFASFFPTVVNADPVTFTYRIDIAQRCSPAECIPFPASFLLGLSFDSEITGAINEPEYRVRWYGAPTFSAIPLDRPEILAGSTEFASTTDVGLVVPPFEWRHVAQAQRGAQLITPDYDYRWYLGIYEVQDFFKSAPELSPASFGAFLGSGRNPTAFGYAFSGLDRHRPGVLSANSVGYSGTAILQDEPAPVPEPISFVLVSTGLCGLGAQAWRRKRLGSKSN